MSIDMIAEIAMGTAEIPESEPAEAVVVVIPIEPSMSTDDYDVSILQPAILPDADVVVSAQTTDDVTITVTRPDGFAGTPGITVHALCIKRIGDSGWVDVSAYLDAGWTGTARLLKTVASIVYFQFDLTAAASIDGTPKTDSARVLDLDAFNPDWVGDSGSLGGCYTDTNEPVRAYINSDIFAEGAAGVTGNWTDGVSTLYGQVSWVAG